MPLTPDKFVIADGAPSGGNQATTSSAFGDSDIAARLTSVASDGTLTGDGTSGDPLSVAEPYTDAERTKLAGVEAGAQVNTVASVAGKTGAVSLVLGDSSFEINVQAGTSYTLTDADHGKMVTLENAAAITLTVPTGLRSDFYCSILQRGAGQVTITGSGAAVNNRQGHTMTAGVWSMVSIISVGADTYVTQGDTA